MFVQAEAAGIKVVMVAHPKLAMYGGVEAVQKMENERRRGEGLPDLEFVGDAIFDGASEIDLNDPFGLDGVG